MKRFGILTGGGDCPGLNAVIRGAVMKLNEQGAECLGLLDGWKGAIEGNYIYLNPAKVEGIQTKGGTILGSSRTNVMKIDDGPERVRQTMKNFELDGIIAIGGDDTLGVAGKLTAKGMNMVGVPKTIDNDLSATDYTFGFDTAANITMEAIDRLHTTADSHSRAMIVEVMGRHTGWIAIKAGMAADAHMILIPEFPVHIDEIIDLVLRRKEAGKNYHMIVVAEGFWPQGVAMPEGEARDPFGNVILPDRSVAKMLATQIEKKTDIESRYVVLGHLQRGGAPSVYDRVLGTRMGICAATLSLAGEFGKMVALRGTEVIGVPIDAGVSQRKMVTRSLYRDAKLFEL